MADPPVRATVKSGVENPDGTGVAVQLELPKICGTDHPELVQFE
jgi:hypothetical protein